MNAPLPVRVAANFYLDASTDRVLIADGAGWRALNEEEMSGFATDETSLLLFTLPTRLRTACWTVLEKNAEDFDGVAAEIASFLSFKQLAPPKGATFELVLHGPAGTLASSGFWAIVNLGDDLAVITVPGVRLQLRTGEGCRFPEGCAVQVVAPASETPHMLLAIRLSSEK